VGVPAGSSNENPWPVGEPGGGASSWDDWRYWDSAHDLAWAAWDAWDDLRLAQDPTCGTEAYRQVILSNLRRKLGVENYYMGRMPFPVPMQFYRERD